MVRKELPGWRTGEKGIKAILISCKGFIFRKLDFSEILFRLRCQQIHLL